MAPRGPMNYEMFREETGMFDEDSEYHVTPAEAVFLPMMAAVFGAMASALVVGSGLASLAILGAFWSALFG